MQPHHVVEEEPRRLLSCVRRMGRNQMHHFGAAVSDCENTIIYRGMWTVVQSKEMDCHRRSGNTTEWSSTQGDFRFAFASWQLGQERT